MPIPPTTFSASSASDCAASRTDRSAASSHDSLPNFMIAAVVFAAPPRRELTQTTFAPASAIAIAIAWPRPLLAPVTMAVSPSSENAFALGIVRSVEIYLLNPRNQKMDDQQRGHIGQPAHDEDRRVVVPVGLKDNTCRTLKRTPPIAPANPPIP